MAENNEMEVYFSRPGSNSEIRKALLEKIRSAKKRLYMAMAYINDKEMISEILNSSAEDKRILLNLEDINKYYSNYEMFFEEQFRDNIKVIGSGPHYYGTMHHKFLVIDNYVCTGSYNLTIRAMNRNWENVVCLNNEEMLNNFINQFLQIWNSANHLQGELNNKIKYKRERKLVCTECNEEVEDILEHYLVSFDAFNYITENQERYIYRCNRNHLDEDIECTECDKVIDRGEVFIITYGDHIGYQYDRYFCPMCVPEINRANPYLKFPIISLIEDMFNSKEGEETTYTFIDYINKTPLISGNDLEITEALGMYPGAFVVGNNISLFGRMYKIKNFQKDYEKKIVYFEVELI